MTLTAGQVALCNQSLDRLGATNFTFANQATDVNGIRCERNYDQTRLSLLRSFEWNFARSRKILTIDTSYPSFEWDYRCKLPDDFLRLRRRGLYSDYTYVIEGDYLLTNDSEPEIRYIKNVDNPDDFDPMFKDVLILMLAKRLIPVVVGTKSTPLVDDILRDLQFAMVRAKAVNASENETKEDETWNSARYGSGMV